MNVKQATLQRIQALCQERNTTINEVLQNCQIDPAAANALLSGAGADPFIEDLGQICEALGTNLADFFHDDIFLK
jgi:transcriptional regulator with XRE-family HTH domain